jgi:3-oxoacyl-[acyl-carrier-protein] synthase II
VVERKGQHPVAITGIGCVSPVGIGREASWSRILAGEGGVTEVTRFDASGYPVRIAAQIDGFDATNYLEPKEARRTDRFIQYAVAAARQRRARRRHHRHRNGRSGNV